MVVLQRLGLPDESVSPVAWADLDRAVRPDHLTSLWIPRLAPPVGAELIGFWELVRTLRERCPWDRAQTPHSLRRYLLEESYEVLDALDRLDPDDGRGADDVADELGDLLFQVVFHAVIAEESGWFTLADVAAGIHRKLVRRHPHVVRGRSPAPPATPVPPATSAPSCATGTTSSARSGRRRWPPVRRPRRTRRRGPSTACPGPCLRSPTRPSSSAGPPPPATTPTPVSPRCGR